MKLLSISVGKPKSVIWNKKEVLTSIFKSPIEGLAEVTFLNIVGDKQADLTVHGGADKAIYAFSFDTYDFWQKNLNVAKLPYGSFGENLTIDLMDEKNIFVGDIFQLGSCELQVVQPRFPCFKLGIKFKDMKVIDTFNQQHRPGVYFRVLKEGQIKAGDSLKLISSEKIKASISELYQFWKDKGVTTKERASELTQIKSMNQKWIDKFNKIANS